MVLNYSLGALNPFAVEVGAKIGSKVLFAPTWMPNIMPPVGAAAPRLARR